VTHVDLLYAQGLHQNNRRHVKPPFTLGTEFAGIVLSSPATSAFPPGTRVFGGGLGAFAEEICISADAVRRVPVQWTNAQACAVGASGAVSYGALMDVVRVRAGESVLVLGASGGLGVMAVQIAKAVGATVIAVVGGEEKGRIVERLGADVVVDYRKDGWEERVRQATPDALGVDVVYDAIGAVESGIKCLKYRGRLVIVGFAARGGKMEKVAANRILLKSAMVHGYVSACIDLLAYDTDHKERGSARMGDMILRRRKMYGMDSCSWSSKERFSPSYTVSSIVGWRLFPGL
jgi:NADPH:quinone reductase-like Zn-dependent oxidoreductase